MDEKQRQRQRARKSRAGRSQKPPRQALEGSSAASAAHLPIHACLVPKELFTVGLGMVILARSLPNGELAVAVFLLDVFCLGIKEAFYRVESAQQFAMLLRTAEETSRLEQVDPSCLRKLVEGAAEYARALGFAPHPAYA